MLDASSQEVEAVEPPPFVPMELEKLTRYFRAKTLEAEVAGNNTQAFINRSVAYYLATIEEER